VLHLAVRALAGDVAELVALVAPGAALGLGALLGDVANLAAVVALDGLGAAGGTLLAVGASGSALVDGLLAVAGEVVTAAVVALLVARGLATRSAGAIAVGGAGALGRQVSGLVAVEALAGIRAAILRVLLRAIAADVVGGTTSVARLARLGHFLLFLT